MNVLILFFIPLVLSILIEFGVWGLFFYKSLKFKYLWLTIIAVNLLTNPMVNCISVFFNPNRSSMLFELSAEVIVVLVETVCFFLIYKKKFKLLLLFSFLANLISYSIGLLLFKPPWL